MNLQKKKATPADKDTSKSSPTDTGVAGANPSEVVGDLIEQAMSLDVQVTQRTAKHVDKDKFKVFIDDVAKQYSTDPSVALVGVFGTLQAGGTSKNKRSNVKLTIKGIAFESKKINEIMLKHFKDITPRQFARFFANEIVQIATKYDITGNAYVSLSRFYSQKLTEASDVEKFWCADFQIDNPKCPEHIREALQSRYVDKFRGSGKKFS